MQLLCRCIILTTQAGCPGLLCFQGLRQMHSLHVPYQLITYILQAARACAGMAGMGALCAGVHSTAFPACQH